MGLAHLAHAALILDSSAVLVEGTWRGPITDPSCPRLGRSWRRFSAWLALSGEPFRAFVASLGYGSAGLRRLTGYPGALTFRRGVSSGALGATWAGNAAVASS